MKKNMSRSTAGFSLVELMVVVAIIGILATIAVPNFQRFQAKAKQSNAKVELSGIYTAEKAFFTEYQTYHGNLPGIGFLPDGYDSSGNSVGNSVRYYASAAGTPIAAGSAGGWPAALPTPAAFAGFGASGTVCNVAASVTLGSATVSQDAFTASAAGCPKSANQCGTVAAGGTCDLWHINENKLLSNVASGI